MPSYITKEDQAHIDARMKEKTKPEPSIPKDWEPPTAKPILSKKDATLVDRRLKKLFTPDPPRE